MNYNNIPFSWKISKISYDSSKIIKGIVFGYLIMYSLGATYIIYKGGINYVRSR